MVRRFTGTVRHSPLDRPRTLSSRDPATLIPNRVRPATPPLKRCRVNHPGRTYRSPAKCIPFVAPQNLRAD